MAAFRIHDAGDAFVRAVVFDGQLQVREQPAPQPIRSDQVIVDVLKAGICETDLQICQGYMGFQGTLGHEFVGVARSGRHAGQRVVGEINCACGHCDYCTQGLSSHCPARTVIGILNHDGAFADSLLVPEQNLHAVPDHVTDEQAVFVEPLAAACRIPQQIRLQPQDQVIILGDGRLGNLCAQVLRHHGCRVLVVGRHNFKLQLLREMRIDTCLLSELDRQRRADIVVDCTGSPSGLETALQIVRPCGTIVLKTTVAAPQSLHVAPLVIDEVRLIGSRCGPFQDALQLLSTGAVRVDPLITARYPLQEAPAAFRQAAGRDTLKVLLDVADSR